MDIDIRALTRENISDFFYFFDNVAFTDNEEWSWCYCTHFHNDAAVLEELDKGGKNEVRIWAEKLINNGMLNGYLAYENGSVIGWCAAGDRENYARLKEMPELWDISGEKVKSIVCFLIAPDKRGQGIATLLLERACADADHEGYDFLEAYPACGSDDCFHNYHGYATMFEKCGFVLHKRLDSYSIVRKKS